VADCAATAHSLPGALRWGTGGVRRDVRGLRRVLGDGTAAGLYELLRECLSVAPGLADAEYLYTRVGLRPTSSDDRPVVGAVPGWDNVWVATGHGANGLLLGPYTAALLAAELTGNSATVGIPAELDPARFS
jgi:D-amino-acid dehydrogenase